MGYSRSIAGVSTAGLAVVLLLTQVSAQEATSVRRDVASPHEAKAAKPTAPSFASLGDIGFTDPYAAPVHPNKLKNSGFLRSVDAPGRGSQRRLFGLRGQGFPQRADERGAQAPLLISAC